MSASVWEVVPPLGISIIPNCDGQGSRNDLNVSRETHAEAQTESSPKRDSSAESDVSSDADVSRETIQLRDSEPDSEMADGPSGSRNIFEAKTPPESTGGAVLDPSPEESTGRGNASSSGSSAVEVEEFEIPEGMTPPDSVKRILGVNVVSRPSLDNVKILAFANQKGGVGKTTSAVNIAAALALLGYEVLLIDMDPQGNASTALGVDHAPGTMSTYEVLVDGKSLLDVVQPSPGLSGLTVAPATVDLAGAEIELVSEIGREGRLRSALTTYIGEHEERHRKLDFVIVDCPPSLGLLTINALAAVDEILIPLQCEYYALEGLGQLMGSVGLVREYVNPTLTVAGIVLTMYDGRTKLAPQVAEEARSHFPELVYEAVIPRSVRISEAPSYSQTVLTYDPASAGARAYLACARELVER